MTNVHIQLLQIKEEFEPFLAWVRTQSPQRILEIGTHQGGSAMHFCAIAPALVVSVDLPEGMHGGLTAEQCEARNLMIQRTFPQFRSLLGSSHDPTIRARVVDLLAGQLFDGLFIDGDHTSVGVLQDYEWYAPLVRPGGWIAFHDINDTDHHRSLGCDVAPVWQGLIGPKQEFTVRGMWGGIGVLSV